jgi:DNA invertase Pin-like site-specific DNA recombinase
MLAIYTRISRKDKNDEGISLANQAYRGKQLAEKLGIKYEVYEDEGKSGELSVEMRPAFKKMRDDILSKRITAVYALNQSRLDRQKLIEFLALINFFKTNNIALYLNQELYDLNNAATELNMNVLAVINHNHNQQLKANVSSALEQNIVEGKVSGGPLITYGYTKDANKKMIINAVEAEVIRVIFELALEGKGTMVIANILNERGIPTKRMNVKTGGTMTVRGKKKSVFAWRDSVVYGMLTDSIYKGERIYKGKKFSIEPIIDATVFDLVQKQLQQRNQFKDTTNKYNYLLKGLIDCPICGSKIQGKKRANLKDNCYTCSSKRYGPNCGNKGINIEYLDTLVCDAIRDLEQIATKALDNEEIKKKNAINNWQVQNIQKEIDRLNRELDNLIAIIRKGTLKRNERIEKEIEIIQNDLDKYESSKLALLKELTIDRERENIIELSRKGATDFKKLKKFEEKVNFLRNAIQSITVKWLDEFNVYDVCIYFMINQMEQYRIARELIIDRNSRKNGKAVSKILSDKVALQTIVMANEKNEIENKMYYVNYGEHKII